jgi:hypothetical protein
MKRRHLKPRERAAILAMSTGHPLAKVRVGEVPSTKLGKGSKAPHPLRPGRGHETAASQWVRLKKDPFMKHLLLQRWGDS